MIIIAVTMLTLFHPGVAFAGNWAAAGWKLRKAKGGEAAGAVEESKIEMMVETTRV